MIHKLHPTEYERARPLLGALDHHLAPQALLSGSMPGAVYADDPARPASALARIGPRFYLAGFEGNDGFNQGLRRLFLDEVFPQTQKEGKDYMGLYSAQGWADAIVRILAGKDPVHVPRQVWAYRALRHNWRALLPAGFEVRAVDGALLDEGLANTGRLREEMVSETPSVDAFLAGRFGACAVDRQAGPGGTLAGWCLSEYNWRDRCEVGIETVAAYRRRGIATATASALVEEALRRGIRHIGWHCYASNEGSQATARAVGFEKVHESWVYYAWFDEVVNLGVHGNTHFQQGRYREAIAWYERALAAGEAPVWVTINAANAHGRLGEAGAAWSYLRRAVEQGFGDVEYLETTPHLEALRGTAEWRALLAEVEGDTE